jgi:hypothetical protein
MEGYVVMYAEMCLRVSLCDVTFCRFGFEDQRSGGGPPEQVADEQVQDLQAWWV